jgi:hypothetical protein
MENGNSKLLFVRGKRKRKTEVCFPWSTNDKRQSTIAVSVNLPIYGLCPSMDLAHQNIILIGRSYDLPNGIFMHFFSIAFTFNV